MIEGVLAEIIQTLFAANAIILAVMAAAAILPDVTAEDARRAADRVRRAVQASIITAGEHHLSMTVSAGIYHSAAGAADFDTMLWIADAGLYAAKNGGRDRVESLAA